MSELDSHTHHSSHSSRLLGYSAILSDLVVWLLAVELATLARFDFDARYVHWETITELALFLAGGQFILGAIVLLYGGKYVPGSFDEMRAVAVSVTAVSVIASAVILSAHPVGIPRSVPFLAWPLAIVGMASIRFVKRLIWQSEIRPRGDAERILVYGAGWVGSALAARMLRDPASRFLPVGFLDDDPAKRHFQAHGVRVLGRFDDLAGAVERSGASRVVIAVNAADATLIRRVSDAADEVGVACMVLPALSDTLRAPQIQLSTLRNVDVQDVIGRRPVDTDVRAIADVRHGTPGAGHRGGRLDRLRTLPAAAQVRSGRTGPARPGRVGPARGRAVHLRQRAARLDRNRSGATSAIATLSIWCSPSISRRSSSTPPPSST